MKLATSILKSEVQELMDKKFGLHMHATSLKAEQFEKGHVCFLKLLYEEKGPNTWGLLRQLLDVQHINCAQRWAAPILQETANVADDEEQQVVEMDIGEGGNSKSTIDAGKQNGALLDTVSRFHMGKKYNAYIKG